MHSGKSVLRKKTVRKGKNSPIIYKFKFLVGILFAIFFNFFQPLDKGSVKKLRLPCHASFFWYSTAVSVHLHDSWVNLSCSIETE